MQEDLHKLKLIQAYINYKGISDAEYDELVKAGTVEDGMPLTSGLILGFGKKPLDRIEISASVEADKKEIADYKVT